MLCLACNKTRVLLLLGPSNWNKLPQSLTELLPVSHDQFRKHLKTSLFVSEDTDPGRERLCYNLYKWHYTITVRYNFVYWQDYKKVRVPADTPQLQDG